MLGKGRHCMVNDLNFEIWCGNTKNSSPYCFFYSFIPVRVRRCLARPSVRQHVTFSKLSSGWDKRNCDRCDKKSSLLFSTSRVPSSRPYELKTKATGSTMLNDRANWPHWRGATLTIYKEILVWMGSLRKFFVNNQLEELLVICVKWRTCHIVVVMQKYT